MGEQASTLPLDFMESLIWFIEVRVCLVCLILDVFELIYHVLSF